MDGAQEDWQTQSGDKINKIISRRHTHKESSKCVQEAIEYLDLSRSEVPPDRHTHNFDQVAQALANACLVVYTPTGCLGMN
jgi:hypothetical protein